MIDLLCDALRFIRSKFKSEPPYKMFLEALKTGNSELVKSFIEDGELDLDKPINDIIPLLLAAEMGHTDVAKLLIESGADVNNHINGGYTPLLLAAEMGHTEVVKLLIESGADVNKHINGGYTPLLLAAEMGHIDVVNFLLKKQIEELKSKSADHETLTQDYHDSSNHDYMGEAADHTDEL